MTVRIVSPGANSDICSTQRTRVPLRMATSPLSGCTRPFRISSSVDLPEPLGPIIPMRAPSETVNEIARKSGSTPYRLESPCALIIGGNVLAVLPESVSVRITAARRDYVLPSDYLFLPDCFLPFPAKSRSQNCYD